MLKEKEEEHKKLKQPLQSRKEELMHEALSRMTYKNGGHKVQVGQKITIDTQNK